jgi:phosphoribosylformylglycinamidine (FGAM) synthase PurS component
VRIEAVVRRKTQDLVQDAGEDLVRRVIPGVARVDRAELWAFEVEAPDGAARVREILDGTTLVVNPNVHRYSLEPWDEAPQRGARLLLCVRDRVDPRGAQVLRAVRDRLGHADVTAASRAVLWRVDLESADVSAAEEAGRALTGAGRGAGILANPHAQDTLLQVVTP